MNDNDTCLFFGHGGDPSTVRNRLSQRRQRAKSKEESCKYNSVHAHTHDQIHMTITLMTVDTFITQNDDYTD